MYYYKQNQSIVLKITKKCTQGSRQVASRAPVYPQPPFHFPATPDIYIRKYGTFKYSLV